MWGHVRILVCVAILLSVAKVQGETELFLLEWFPFKSLIVQALYGVFWTEVYCPVSVKLIWFRCYVSIIGTKLIVLIFQKKSWLMKVKLLIHLEVKLWMDLAFIPWLCFYKGNRPVISHSLFLDNISLRTCTTSEIVRCCGFDFFTIVLMILIHFQGYKVVWKMIIVAFLDSVSLYLHFFFFFLSFFFSFFFFLSSFSENPIFTMLLFYHSLTCSWTVFIACMYTF